MKEPPLTQPRRLTLHAPTAVQPGAPPACFQQPPLPVARSQSPAPIRRSPAAPSSPPRRSREGGNPAQPSLAYQPRSPTATSRSLFPRCPLVAPSSFPRPPRRSREGGNPAQPSLAYQPRCPTATSPGRPLPAPAFVVPPLPPRRPLVPATPCVPPSSFPRPPRRSREGGNPAQPSLAYQPRCPTATSPGRPLPFVVPLLPPPPLVVPPRPLVAPSKAGTQRNHPSHTNQGLQQPPLPVARSRRFHAPRRSRSHSSSSPAPCPSSSRAPSSFPRPPRRSRDPLVVPPLPPRRPLVVPAKAGTQRNRPSHTNQGLQQPPLAVARSRRFHAPSSRFKVRSSVFSNHQIRLCKGLRKRESRRWGRPGFMTYLSGRGTCIWAPRSGAMGCGCQPMILLQVCSCGNLRCTDGNRRSGAQSLVWCRRPGGHRCIDCVFTRFTVARSGRAATDPAALPIRSRRSATDGRRTDLDTRRWPRGDYTCPIQRRRHSSFARGVGT